MKLFKRIIKIILLVLLSIVILLGIIWLLPERTPEIKSSGENAVSKIDYIVKVLNL